MVKTPKKDKWKLIELSRFDTVMLQISKYELDTDTYEVVGTITLHENDMESRVEWIKAIENMNLESSQKSS